MFRRTLLTPKTPIRAFSCTAKYLKVIPEATQTTPGKRPANMDRSASEMKTDAADALNSQTSGSTGAKGATDPPAFSKDGAIGSMFKADGAVGGVADKIGGPLSKDGAIGKNFNEDGAIGGTVDENLGKK